MAHYSTQPACIKSPELGYYYAHKEESVLRALKLLTTLSTLG